MEQGRGSIPRTATRAASQPHKLFEIRLTRQARTRPTGRAPATRTEHGTRTRNAVKTQANKDQQHKPRARKTGAAGVPAREHETRTARPCGGVCSRFNLLAEFAIMAQRREHARQVRTRRPQALKRTSTSTGTGKDTATTYDERQHGGRVVVAGNVPAWPFVETAAAVRMLIRTHAANADKTSQATPARVLGTAQGKRQQGRQQQRRRGVL